MTRRLHLFIALIALVAIVVSGVAFAGPTAFAQAPTKPVISAKIGDKVVKGIASSYCWPDDAGKPQCDIVDDPEPTAEIAWSGEPITFVVEPPVAKIDQWQVAFLDMRSEDGEPVTVDIKETNGVFTPPPDLKPGKQRLQVELFTDNQDSFVFYVFLVNYSGSAAATAPGATAVAVNPTPAENATMAATAPTAAASEATTAATSAAFETTPATPATMASTEPATMATMAATTGAVEAVGTAESAGTSPATSAATLPAMAASVTPLPTSTPTTTRTPTAVPPTATPPGPTATPAPPTATFAIAPNADVPAPDSLFPGAVLVIGSTEYRPIAIEGCQIKPENARTCISGAVRGTAAANAQGKGEADTLFVFKGTPPSVVKLTTRAADGIKIISEETVTPSNVILSTLPKSPGNYILTLEVTFEGGQVTYFFRVTVS